MAPRSQRESGRRFSSAGRPDKDRSFAKNAQRGGVEENGIGTNSQQPPKQVPDNAKAPARVQREQAVTTAESECRNVGTAKGNTPPARLIRLKYFELALLQLDCKIQLTPVDGQIIASRHSKPAEVAT